MAQAKAGDTVKVHYKGELEDGTVFDSSEGRDPLEFTLGSGNVIAGFDRAVTGMAPGESKTETIPCADAYGERHEGMMIEIARAEVPPGMDLKVGQELRLQNKMGRVIAAMVTEVGQESVKLDGNHLLAGRDLIFHIDLVEIL